LLAEELQGVLDVVMTGESQIAVELLEAVPVRKSADLLQRPGRLAAAQQIEDAQALPRARRGVDPGYKALVDLRGQADGEAPVVPLFLKAQAVPDQLEVVREVERVEVLVGGREPRDRAALALRHDGPIAGGDGRGLLLRGRAHAPQP